MNDARTRDPDSDEPRDAAPPADDSFQAVLARLFGPKPDEPIADWLVAAPSRQRRLAALALGGLVLHGGVAGLFAGDGQALVAAAKAPLVVAFALALCLPSLAVSTALAGARWTARRLAAAALAFAAGLALLLVTLLPISWLFTVSSRHLTSLVVLHVLAWIVALGFAQRALRSFVPAGARLALALWTWLFLAVSLQSATYLQPILWREPGAALFPRPRQFFLEHFAAAAKVTLPADAPPTPPAE
jgi:hypothetical protein